MKKGALSAWYVPGGELVVRVTPGASRETIAEDDGGLKVSVTAPPENGKANQAVQKLLARALGIPKTRLTLLRGAGSRLKTFRMEA